MLMRRSLVLEDQVELVNNLKLCLAGGWRVASNKLSIWVFVADVGMLQGGKNMIKEKRHTGAPDSDKAQWFLDFWKATYFYVFTVKDSPAKLFSTVNMQ